MAGSYQHCVDPEGKLLVNEQLQGMLECCSGDVYEAIEEMYGMIWYLADELRVAVKGHSAAPLVERARLRYEVGLRVSPGTDGSNPRED